MRGQKIGKAWVIFSQETDTGFCRLLSLQNPRIPSKTIARFIEQIYVDRLGSFEEKISYKKRRSNWPYPAKIELPSRVISCGFGPIYFGYYCHKITIKSDVIHAEYRHIKQIDENLRPVSHAEGTFEISVT